MLTDAELIALGKKVIAQRDKDKTRGKATAKAVARLKAAHLPEFKGYLAEELGK